MSKKKTFYIFSDVHSFYNEFIEALEASGYKEDDPDAVLVCLNDSFDRGPGSVAMLDWLNNHPDCILVKSNHDLLMQDMLNRGFYESIDVSNGTVRTLLDLAGVKDKRITYWGIEDFTSEDWEKACEIVKEKLQPIYDRSINYFETANYIMVHSFIPIKYATEEDSEFSELPDLYYPGQKIYDPNWREAGDYAWQESVWCNPFKMVDLGFNQTGKTIIAGHWATAWKHGRDKIKELREQDIWDYDEEQIMWGPEANHDIYYGDGIIGVDATTAMSHKVNILVLEDELLEEDSDG